MLHTFPDRLGIEHAVYAVVPAARQNQSNDRFQFGLGILSKIMLLLRFVGWHP